MVNPRPSEKLLSRADLLTPAVIRAAATLCVADHIAAGATTAAAVAERAGARSDVMAALLRRMAELELLTATDSGPEGEPHEQHFALTEAGDPLRSDHPISVRQALRNDGMVGSGALSLLRLDHTVRTGEPAVAADGGNYWERVNGEPEYVDEWAEQSRALDQAQDQALHWDADSIVTAYDWSRVGSVVDAGGHLGVILMALLRKHPHLRGTLVDLKNVSEQAGRRFAASDVADRAEAVVGSFFEPLPRADVYLLSAILADWSDADAVRILANCRSSAGADGRILLAEVAMPTDSAAMELRMRSMMPAPSRSLPELEALGAAAGLRVTWRGPSTAVRTLLEFVPA
ncbi:methyltransferase [Streptomyces sp. NPDC048392]|uniref:methyltransferase n=1 Tax=Streptomyces sp. NPDC048392 TaxID=3365543 RepID=UPI003723DFB5